MALPRSLRGAHHGTVLEVWEELWGGAEPQECNGQQRGQLSGPRERAVWARPQSGAFNRGTCLGCGDPEGEGSRATTLTSFPSLPLISCLPPSLTKPKHKPEATSHTGVPPRQRCTEARWSPMPLTVPLRHPWEVCATGPDIRAVDQKPLERAEVHAFHHCAPQEPGRSPAGGVVELPECTSLPFPNQARHTGACHTVV